MIYNEPIFHIGGDSFLTIELGDDGSLFLNLYILTLEKMIWESEIPGLIDTTALRTTIMIHYDPFIIRAHQLIKQLQDLIAGGVEVPKKFSSRLIHLPVYYNDPWTKECAKAFGLPPNLEIIAGENNISIEKVIEIHSKPIYFVSYTSFMYGSFGAFPIDPFTTLKNSKYKTPRKWTPPGTIGIGGTTTTYYSITSPGGLMMLGNIPVKTFDTEGRNKFFKEDPLLIHPGDRIRFFPIDGEEYEHIKENMDECFYKTEESYIDSTKK